MILQNCTAQNYGSGIIPQILSRVDQTGCAYVQGAFQELARDVTAGGAGASIASLLLIAYVILWGFGVWSGTATGTATDAAFRLFRAFVIYALATSWSDFTSFAYTLFNDGPAAVGNRLLSVGNNNAYTSPNAVVSALEAIWNQTAQGFQLHFAFSLQSFASALVGLACVIVIALFLAVATFTIILSKVFLWLVLGIAPLMILLLLFDASSRYFSGWLSAAVMYAMLQVLVYSFLAFYLTVTQPIFASLGNAIASGQVDWGALAPFFLVGLTGVFLLSQLPGMAARSPAASRSMRRRSADCGARSAPMARSSLLESPAPASPSAPARDTGWTAHGGTGSPAPAMNAFTARAPLMSSPKRWIGFEHVATEFPQNRRRTGPRRSDCVWSEQRYRRGRAPCRLLPGGRKLGGGSHAVEKFYAIDRLDHRRRNDSRSARSHSVARRPRAAKDL